MLVKDGKKFYSIPEQVQRLTNWKNGEGSETLIKGRSIFSVNSQNDFVALFNDFINGDTILFGETFSLSLPDEVVVNVKKGDIFEVEKFMDEISLVFRTNLEGEKGDTGNTGATGPRGNDGASGAVYEYFAAITINGAPYNYLSNATIFIQFCSDNTILNNIDNPNLKMFVAGHLIDKSVLGGSIYLNASGASFNIQNNVCGLISSIGFKLTGNDIFIEINWVDFSTTNLIVPLSISYWLDSEFLSINITSIRKVTP